MAETRDNEIMVSVYCLAYNHEKYIRKALDGFVMQKTNFPFEVIVHDDASTDNTAAIIQEYADKYPDIIKPIFQTENQYSKGVKIAKTFIYPKMKGKYVAMCEGDDYWTDENKLQLQFDAMEAHPECSFCSHYVKKISVATGEVTGYYPEKDKNLSEGVMDKVTQLNLMMCSFQFQLTSYFIRKTYYDDYMTNTPAFANIINTGDNAILAYFSIKGKHYFIPKEMSVYNWGTEGSWTKRVGSNLEHFESLYIGKKEWLNSFAEEEYQRELVREFLPSLKFKIELMKGNDKFLLKKENRQYLKKLPFRWRVKIYICAYMPFISKIYYKLKNKKKQSI